MARSLAAVAAVALAFLASLVSCGGGEPIPRIRPVATPSIDQPVTRSADAAADGEVLAQDSRPEPAPDTVVRWLSDRALPIATAEPRPATDDLDAVAKLLASSRVIGIGEATHGTREYFRLKHRLLERLVTHHGMTLLAMEANFSDAERVDAWVQTGRGTVEDAMKGLFLVWRTEEVRDLLLWMREWNADPKHKKKIRFRGYDVQGTRASMAAVRLYLRKVDVSAASTLLSPLTTLDEETNPRGMIELEDVTAAKLREALARLVEHVVSSRRSYIERSSGAEYELAIRHVRALEQALARYTAKGSSARFAARDRAMAENVVWLSTQIAKDERMMVWAHNGHIQLDSSTLLGANMGSQLRERLGHDYLAAGFVLDEERIAHGRTPTPQKKSTLRSDRVNRGGPRRRSHG